MRRETAPAVHTQPSRQQTRGPPRSNPHCFGGNDRRFRRHIGHVPGRNLLGPRCVFPHARLSALNPLSGLGESLLPASPLRPFSPPPTSSWTNLNTQQSQKQIRAALLSEACLGGASPRPSAPSASSGFFSVLPHPPLPWVGRSSMANTYHVKRAPRLRPLLYPCCLLRCLQLQPLALAPEGQPLQQPPRSAGGLLADRTAPTVARRASCTQRPPGPVRGAPHVQTPGGGR